MATDRPVGRVGYVANTNLVRVDKLFDVAADDYINDATVTVTVKDTDGNTITGETFPKSMPYVTGSDGRYEAALSNALALVDGAEYEAVISVNGTETFNHPFVASKRRTI